MSRRTVLLVVAAVSVLSALGGWLLGQQIESPAEAAARVAPPPASLISVPVEFRELSSAVVTRGTVEFDQSTNIEVSGSEAGSSIITRIPKSEGDDLLEGEVAVEVAGRPLIVLQGELPVFRSFTPGLEGPDVLQLEEALVRLGYNPGPVDGVYGGLTEDAIEELYRDVGYPAPAQDAIEQSTLEGARDRASNAQDALRRAQADAQSGGLPQSQRLELDRLVAQAQQGIDDLVALRDGELASLRSERDARTRDLDSAEVQLVTANSRLRSAVDDNIHPDTGIAPTVNEIRLLREAKRVARVDRDSAAAALSGAQSALAAAAGPLNSQITNAEVDLQIARAQRSEAITQANQGGGAELVDQARDEVADSQEALTKLEKEIGTRVPATEIIFLPSLPRLVQQVIVDVGDFPQGPVMRVTGSELAITSGVSSADRQLLEVGMTAFLDDPNLDLRIEGTIDFIADNPGGPNLSSDRYRIRVVPTGDVPEDAYNQNLRLRIPISSTGGEVLAVPLAAVSAGADGTSRVERVTGDDQTELVEVSVGLSAQGFVQVEALGGESLDDSDRVVVGRDQPDEVDDVEAEEPADEEAAA